MIMNDCYKNRDVNVWLREGSYLPGLFFDGQRALSPEP